MKTNSKMSYITKCRLLILIIFFQLNSLNTLLAERYVVINNNSSGAGSFSQAINDANAHIGFDTILFDTNVRGTITINYGLPLITESVVIYGPGADLLSIDPEFIGRGLMTKDFHSDSLFVFGLTFKNGDSQVGAGAGIYLDGGKTRFYNCKITGNQNSYQYAGGGGVYIFGGYTYFFNCEISNNTCYGSGAGIAIASGSKVFIYNSCISNNSVISGNTNNGGGAIYNVGDTYIENSTISGNSHPNFGGGIYNLLHDRNISLNHVTISNNSANMGGGIYNADENGTDTIRIKNSIIAGNVATTESNDLWGEFISEGNNVIQDVTGAAIGGTTGTNIYNSNPLLGSLNYYSYQTQFHPLLPGSPAIDKIDQSESLPNDQCGSKRLIDGDNNGGYKSDIGAVEYMIDTDFDGICDKDEQGQDGSEDGYDGNNDGTPDKNQKNVTSLKTYDGSYYMTIAAPENTCLSQVRGTRAPIQTKKSTSEDFPFGFFSFKVDSLHKASNLNVVFYLPSGTTITNFNNFGPRPTEAFPHLYLFNSNGQTGAEIENSIITVKYIDGQLGDHDLTENNSLLIYGGPQIEKTTSSIFTLGFKSILNYPNPFSSIIKFQLPDNVEKEVTVSIYDLAGKKLKEKVIKINGANSVEVNYSELACGVYFYKIIHGQTIYSGKIIKSNLTFN